MFHEASDSCVGYLKFTHSRDDHRIYKVPLYRSLGPSV